MTTDDDTRPALPGPAIDGEPALFLVESLIHEFIAQGILDRDHAAELVSVALDAQVASCDERDEDPEASAAVAALSRIRLTLAIDAGADGFVSGSDGNDRRSTPPPPPPVGGV